LYSQRACFDFVTLQDISKVKFPEDYPFPESVKGRGRDFRYVPFCTLLSSFLIVFVRACWFIAVEIGVSTIPVSEVSNLPCPLLIAQLTIPVLLRGALQHWRELRPICLLQRSGHAQTGWGTPSGPGQVPCLKYI
jgi:hypothetical protein